MTRSYIQSAPLRGFTKIYKTSTLKNRTSTCIGNSLNFIRKADISNLTRIQFIFLYISSVFHFLKQITGEFLKRPLLLPFKSIHIHYPWLSSMNNMYRVIKFLMCTRAVPALNLVQTQIILMLFMLSLRSPMKMTALCLKLNHICFLQQLSPVHHPIIILTFHMQG